MKIYDNNSVQFFCQTPFIAKRLLHDAVARTNKGLANESVLRGGADVLLARIETVASLVFSGFTIALFVGGSLVMTPLFLVPSTCLSVVTRAPFISAFERTKNVQNFTDDTIYQ